MNNNTPAVNLQKVYVKRVKVTLVKDRANPIKTLDNPRNVFEIVKDLACKDREHFEVLHLDSANGLIARETVSIGILNASLVHPREVFKAAILLGSAGIILVHNHPSGNGRPSREDFEVTKRLRQAGELLGIPVMDHVIIAGEGWTSINTIQT